MYMLPFTLLHHEVGCGCTQMLSLTPVEIPFLVSEFTFTKLTWKEFAPAASACGGETCREGHQVTGAWKAGVFPDILDSKLLLLFLPWYHDCLLFNNMGSHTSLIGVYTPHGICGWQELQGVPMCISFEGFWAVLLSPYSHCSLLRAVTTQICPHFS